ncbi:MAG: hypothetical protein R6V04_07010 [bacterium]
MKQAAWIGIALVLVSLAFAQTYVICPNSDDCVLGDYCYEAYDIERPLNPSGNGEAIVGGDIDGDGDADYCNGGSWVDCVDSCTDCCNDGWDCVDNDCVAGECVGKLDGSSCTGGVCVNDECCTDYAITRQCDDACTSDNADWGCCLYDDECVYNGECYGGRFDIDKSGDDRNITCSNSVWLDCDDTTCSDLQYAMAGETGVGEYGDLTTVECCGDDDSEIENKCYTNSEVAWKGSDVISVTGGTAYTCSSSDPLECCSDFDCIGPDETCYSQGSAVQFYSSGNDTSVICYVWGNMPFVTAGWGDCDSMSSMCGSVCSSAVSGESEPHGEYTQTEIDSGDTDCCGDDDYEYYKCNTESTVCKCCSEDTDVLQETSTDV